MNVYLAGMINAGTRLEEDLAAIWGQHQDGYLAAADLTYRTDQGQSLDQEVKDLLALLARRGLGAGKG